LNWNTWSYYNYKQQWIYTRNYADTGTFCEDYDENKSCYNFKSFLAAKKKKIEYQKPSKNLKTNVNSILCSSWTTPHSESLILDQKRYSVVSIYLGCFILRKSRIRSKEMFSCIRLFRLLHTQIRSKEIFSCVHLFRLFHIQKI